MLIQHAIVIVVVAPSALRLEGMFTYAPFVLLLPFRFSAPVPTWCVVENAPVPVPAATSVPLCGAPAAVAESAATVPLASSSLYQTTTPPAGPPPVPPPAPATPVGPATPPAPAVPVVPATPA